MFNNKQSIILCVIMVVGLFIGGILDILDNFIVLTLLTLLYFTIFINMLILKNGFKEKDIESTKKGLPNDKPSS